MSSEGIEAIASIGVLTDMASSNVFRTPPKAVSDSKRLRVILDSYLSDKNRLDWTLLEGIVVFDKVHYDAYAFSQHELPLDELSRIESLHTGGLTSSRWPKHIYEKAHDSVELLKKEFTELEILQDARSIPADKNEKYSILNDAFWDSADENYHDDLFDSEIGRYSFADTNQSYERAIFYAELSSALGMSMLPRPFKRGSITETIWRSHRQCIHKLLQGRLEDFDRLMRPPEARLKFPPLAESILLQSLIQACSPIDVALELRDTDNAKAYRQYLFFLNQALTEENPSQKQIQEVFTDFDNIVKQWTLDCARAEGIRYKTRHLGMQMVPAVATMVSYIASQDMETTGSVTLTTSTLTAFLGGSVVLRDPILWGGEKYLSFVADWYNN